MHEYLGHTLSSRFPSSLDGLCSGSPRFSLRHFTRMAFLLGPGLLPSNAPSTRSPALPNRPIPFCRFSCSDPPLLPPTSRRAGPYLCWTHMASGELVRRPLSSLPSCSPSIVQTSFTSQGGCSLSQAFRLCTRFPTPFSAW